MPKKISTNPKALEARARKEEKKTKEQEDKIRREEDAKWKEDDSNVLKKLQRKEEQEKKKLEAAQKKAELRALYEEDMNKVVGKTTSTASVKISRAQIDKKLEKERQQRLKEEQERQQLEKKKLAVQELPTDNINRVDVEGAEARTVDEAIAVLSLSSGLDSEIDRHPEKRMKAAYSAFEELHLPRLKEENPNSRLSQLKQILKKEWMKSPDNPLNQRHAAVMAALKSKNQ
jgi:hypothetical protein